MTLIKITICPSCKKKKMTFMDMFWVCSYCNYQTAGITDLKELDKYYNKNDVGLKVQNILEESFDTPIRIYHQVALSIIKDNFSNKHLSLCDVGCGVGVFLRAVKKMKVDVFGYDINKEQTDIAKNKYHLKNVSYAHSLSEYAKKMKIKKEYFNFITAFEVIEHVPDVNIFLQEMNQYLEKGGKIIISTPNSSRLPLKEKWDYPPIHLSRFNKMNIEIFLKNNGFKLLSWKSFNELGYYSNNYIHKLQISQKVLQNMVDDTNKSGETVKQNLNILVQTKRIICKIIDIPLYLFLYPLKQKGHTMILVAEKE